MATGRIIAIRQAVLWMMLGVAPVAAQTSPQPGVLRLPHAGTSGQPADVQAIPPRPAPVTPVQQAAPFTSPPPAHTTVKPAAHPAHKTKPVPVVLAPSNLHPQRAVPAAVAVPPVLEPPATPVEVKGTVTGMKLPRWAALRADEVNLRVGPGTRFPIDWQYRRRDLPVQILREVEVWRLILTQDGVKGWVHRATLVGNRSFVVKGADAVLRGSASDTAAPVASLKLGVIGRIRSCEAVAAWCEVQVEDYRGWLRRAQFWGADPDEAIGN